jgi:hypothetical protein
MLVTEFLGLLRDVRPRGNYWLALCPAHHDQRQSLSVKRGRNQAILVKCHAGCQTKAVVEAIGLHLADLFNDRRRAQARPGGRQARPTPRIVATYDYCDEIGEVLYQSVREQPKAFYQRRPHPRLAKTWLNGMLAGWYAPSRSPNARGWTRVAEPDAGPPADRPDAERMDGVRLVVYRLHELTSLRPPTVTIVEGEADADRLWSLGIPATTNVAGAGKWKAHADDYIEQLKGAGVRKLCLISDNDVPGARHMVDVLQSAVAATLTVVWVMLPDVPEKEDVSWWLDHGGSPRRLREILAQAPIVTAPPLEIATLIGLDGAAESQSAEAAPRRIHLLEIDQTEHIGHVVQTELVIAGVGETFHVPCQWTVKPCAVHVCEFAGRKVDMSGQKALLNFCRMTDDQKHGFMRASASACRHRPALTTMASATITEILVVPAASADLDPLQADYREKVVFILGPLMASHVRYRATGEVIAEPRQQRASLLISRLERLESTTDHFHLTSGLSERFTVLQLPDLSGLAPEQAIVAAEVHVTRLVADVTRGITKIYGLHRETVLLGELLVLHSSAVVPWRHERIKGVLEGLVIGDTAQGKTTQAKRLIERIGLGSFASGSTASRAGVLYHLDSKVNDHRILRWGVFPLAHGEALLLDEAQNIPREQWREFTTARSEGILRVDRSIRAEHPCRVRLLCFANPVRREAMAALQYGIMAVHSDYGFLDPQDLRRFDFVACVAEGDQPMHSILNPPIDAGDRLLPAELLRESILWTWTRQLHQLRYAPGTEEAIQRLAVALHARFGTPEIPLLITDAHEKVARLTYAFAGFLHSTDHTHEFVVAHPIHVALVGRFLESLYEHPNCAFDAYAGVLRRRGGLADGEYEVIEADLLTPGSNREDIEATREMLDLFLTEEELSRADLEAATGLGKDALSRRIAKLRKHRLIVSKRHGYRKTPRFVAFLRRREGGHPNPSNSSNPAS